MKICHIALGGCLTAPDVDYGVTEDTGGHIAYVLGAVAAQGRRRDVTSTEIVTRAFTDPALDQVHAQRHQDIAPRTWITRLRTDAGGYLSKESLADELPNLTDAFLRHIADPVTRPDIIHAHFADAAVLAIAARDKFGIPYIYTPHSLGIDKQAHGNEGGDSNGDSGSLARRIARERAAMENAGAIVVSSRDEAERQIDGYDIDVAGDVHIVAPGVTDRRAASGDGLPPRIAAELDDPSKPLLLAIARPVRRKNLGALARVFAGSAALRARANLVILAGQNCAQSGPASEAHDVWTDLSDQLSAPQTCGHAVLPTTHSRRDVASLYAFAARSGGIFVNPAFHEPFGLTLLEAAAHGLPVVATREGGPADIVARIGHGICIDPTREDELLAALLDMLNDPALRADAADAALRGIRAYDWSVWAGRVQDIYDAVLDPSARDIRSADVLLACDIDDTLTGCRSGAADFVRWHERGDGYFAVATGRSINEARRVLADWNLPVPDAFVTSVGSEIYVRDTAGHFRLHEDYAAHLSRHWNADAVLSAVRASGVTMQADIEQRRWKISCFGGQDDVNRLRAELERFGLKAHIISSHERFIDILPRAAGKGAALSVVARHFGLARGNLIVCGDSGNDADMLRMTPRAIMVANARSELSTRADLRSVYRARTAFAAGVLEGVAHFRSLDAPSNRIGGNP